ncbi:MAG TPA: hypothetical protein VFG04_14385 [Planctomycetaceae bacterium]|nr:hypothetical protein [Planctomycetaceae bacterium]
MRTYHTKFDGLRRTCQEQLANPRGDRHAEPKKAGRERLLPPATVID